MPQFPAAESTIKQAQILVGAIDLSAARMIASNVAQSFDAAVAAMGSKQDEILANADTNKQVAQALDALTSQKNADISRRIQEKTGDVTSQELTSFLESAKLINAQLLTDNTAPIDLGGIVQNLVQQFNKTTDTSQRATLSTAITEVSSKLIGNTQAAIDVQSITDKQQITNELLARLIAGADSKQATRADVKEKAPTVQQTTTADITELSTTLVKALSSVSEKITSAVAPIGTEVSTAALTALTGNAQASKQLINSVTSVGSFVGSGIIQAIAGTETAKRYADSRKKAATAKREKRDIKKAKKQEQSVVRIARRKAQVKRIADKLRAKLLTKLDKKDARRIAALQKSNDSIKTAITLGNVIRLATSAVSVLPLLLSGIAGIAGTIVTGIATFLGGKVTKAFSSIKTFFTGEKQPAKVQSKTDKVQSKPAKVQSKTDKVSRTTLTTAKVKRVGTLGKVGKKLATLLPRIAARHAALTALTIAAPPAAIAANLLATGFDIIDAVKVFSDSEVTKSKPATKTTPYSPKTRGSIKAQKTHATPTLNVDKRMPKYGSNTTMKTNSSVVSNAVDKRTTPQQAVAPNITVQPAPVHVQQSPSSAEHRTTSLDDVGLALLHKQALG